MLSHVRFRPALAAVLLLAPAGLAQTPTFEMDANGNWVAKAPERPLTPDEETLAKARALLADDKASQARSILTDWIDQNVATSNPFLPQAYLLRGDAKTAAGNEYKALYDYEAVIKGFPESEEYNRALERELEIGIKYVYGLKRIWLGVRWSEADDVGEELLVRVAERSPGSKLAERAMIELADYYYRDRDLKLAAESYGIFLANFPKSDYADRARRRRIEANVARFKGPEYDAAGLKNAKILIEDYQAVDPAGAQRANLSDAMVARLEESIAAQVLEKARWYLRRGDPVSGRCSLQRLVVTHPQTVAARTAIQMLQERGWEIPTPAHQPAPNAAAAGVTPPADAPPSHPASEAQPAAPQTPSAQPAATPDASQPAQGAPGPQPPSEPKPAPNSEPKR